MTSTEVEHNDSETSVKSEEVFLGRIKWFNNKSGYGFITITDGIRAGNDIFVHHSGIIVSNEQYKYLVQGEYVEFKLQKSNGPHEYQAVDIRGVRGGQLMCETRKELQQVRSSYKKTDRSEEKAEEKESSRPSEGRRVGRPRRQNTEALESGDRDNGDWKMVRPSRGPRSSTDASAPRSRPRPSA